LALNWWIIYYFKNKIF